MVGTNTGHNGLSCASFIRKYSLALNLRKKTANLKLQQDVRFPFTQLMKTRSTMVEDTKDTYFCISLFFGFFSLTINFSPSNILSHGNGV